MTRNALSLRFFVNRIPQFFYRPSSVFEWIAAEGGRLWLPPLLLITGITVVRILIAGWLRLRIALQGEIPLPRDWTYYTPEMQVQFMQAAEANKSPVVVYILPLIMAPVYLAGQAAQQGGPPPSLAANTPPWLMIFALVFATLIGLMSGIYPALHAATMVPVSALKYE